ncbi:MAG: hypothetical protein R6X27_02465 [Candidatus Desulfacyla sp.]
MIISSRRRDVTTAALVLALTLASPCDASRGSLYDASWQRTYELYREIPHLTPEELDFGAQVILGLDYNSKRVFRQMCRMRGIDFSKSREAWSALTPLGLSYEQVLCFEAWSEIGGIEIDLAISALPEIKSLTYEAGKSFRQYCTLPGISPNHALKTIPLLNRLDDSQNQAVQGLLAVREIKAGEALNGLGEIARLHGHQARAAGAFARIPGMTVAMIGDALPLIRQLDQDNAWNARTLFLTDEMVPDAAWFWLISYFATPLEIREKQFRSFDDQQKQALVRAFYAGGEEIIWKINNLHGVTDQFGFEISNHELLGYSDRHLQERFEMLSPQVKSRFGNSFYQAAAKGTKVSLLKEATAADRFATARRLTSANIYALLSQGSELYDSSFRNILVPVLKNHVQTSFANNLLNFLNATDPGNQLVSSFIVSLAQKGKLTTFFPDNPYEQQQILDLVAESAFKDEDSIILFSATFMYLLEVLEPSARTFLISRMSGQADAGTAAYARLISVILQYYLQEFPHLLLPEDKSMITGLLARHGTVNLGKYLATPFDQWKEDGRLSSLSVFHPDDDGRDSFLSNARMLLAGGYRLALSDQFTVNPLPDSVKKSVPGLIADAQANPAKGLSILFRSMQGNHYAVSFDRTVNGVRISHAAYVYSDEKNQENLMERFILSGAEMFAQRGHSYWRSEQITDPLEKLMQNGTLTEKDLRAKQRFLSLGSCGGVKAYTRLNQMFLGHVDILATIGTGLAVINDPYNKTFFEVVARSPSTITWKDMEGELAFIFQGGHGRDYLQPGSLPAILHKILDEKNTGLPEGVIGSAGGRTG